MVSVTSRELSSQERQGLADRVRSPGLADKAAVELMSVGCFFALSIPFLLLAVPIAWYLGIRTETGWLAFAGVVVLLYAVWRWAGSRKGNAFDRDYAEAISRELANNKVEILHCTATAAVQVDELDDEGPGMYIDVGEGKLLYLQGQYLYPYVWGPNHGTRGTNVKESDLAEKEGTFPSTEFELQRYPVLGETIDLRCIGTHFMPGRHIEPDNSPPPDDGTLLSGRLDKIGRRLTGTA